MGVFLRKHRNPKLIKTHSNAQIRDPHPILRREINFQFGSSKCRKIHCLVRKHRSTVPPKNSELRLANPEKD